MSTNNVLADRDTNTTMDNGKVAAEGVKGDVKSMEYHRQVLQSKLDENKGQQTYISPSDNIMSPATAKLTAYKTKVLTKGSKPKSLFAKASTKNLGSSALFGAIPSKEASKPNTEDDEKMEE